jgi:hypothetical protein
MYARINRGRSSKEPGPAFMMLGNHLALVCLFLGAALAIFVSGAFEQRIGNLLIFGWMPAIGFYATGPMLDQLLIFGGKFCEHAYCALLSEGPARRTRFVELGRHPMSRN